MTLAFGGFERTNACEDTQALNAGDCMRLILQRDPNESCCMTRRSIQLLPLEVKAGLVFCSFAIICKAAHILI